VADPDDPYRYLEVSVTVQSIEDDDTEASFYQALQERYSRPIPIKDAAVRVVVTIRPESFVAHG